MPGRRPVQDVDRGTGIPGALFDAFVRAGFDGEPVAVMKGRHSDADKLRTLFFSEKTRGTVIATTGMSVELEEQYAGDALYRMSVSVCASTATVGTEIDTLHRLHGWLDEAVAASSNLGGRAYRVNVAEADFVQRPLSKRVVMEAVVDVYYSRSRAAR